MTARFTKFAAAAAALAAGLAIASTASARDDGTATEADIEAEQAAVASQARALARKNGDDPEADPLIRQLEDPFADYEGELAPGYQSPEFVVRAPRRETQLPFGSVREDSFRFDQDSALNEFAGQRRNVSQGIVGDTLFSVKRKILGFEGPR